MWAKIEDWGKAHPFGLGLIIFAIGAIIIYFFARGSSSGATASTGQPSDAYYSAQAAIAASGNQLQAAQIAAQVQSTQYGDALNAANTKVAGDIALANIASNQAVATAIIGADVSKTGISAQQEVADTASALTAHVQQAGIDAQVNLASINANAATETARINADATTKLAATNAAVQESSTQAQLAGLKTLVAGQEYVAGSADYTQGVLAAIAAGQGYGTSSQQLNVLYQGNKAVLAGS